MEKDRHKFETELVDFVTEIETAMEELKVGDWYHEDEEIDNYPHKHNQQPLSIKIVLSMQVVAN